MTGLPSANLALAAATDGPRHIAIIMDGNGRWAQSRGLPRVMGHRAGVQAVRNCVRAIGDFRYVGFFKTRKSGRFAAMDSRCYSPLCAVLAAGCVYLASR